MALDQEETRGAANSASHHEPHELSVRGLHVHYGRICAIESVSLSAHCGLRFGIFGPNGAGKSTLLKALACLVPHAQGEILWNGRSLSRSRHEIAYLPQREEVDYTFPITVRGVVEMGRFPDLGWFGRFTSRDVAAVDEAIEAMGLQDLQTRQISALSGGQQQRVFLARALAQRAHLLLLDEPFTGLDVPSRQLLGRLLKQLATEGRLIVMTHHGVNEAEQLFDQVLLLNRIPVAMGSPAEVLGDTTRCKQAGLHGEKNLTPSGQDSTG